MALPLSAKIVRLSRHGGSKVLRLSDEAIPPPGAGEARVIVKAFGLNRAEILFRAGRYVERAEFPARLGYEACGIVDTVGPDVQTVAPGDAVSLIPLPSVTKWGTWGEAVNLPADHLVRHEHDLGWERLAATWMASATAYGMLVDIAALKHGDTVVVGAASSSVGLTAIALAKKLGGVPVALTRSADKRDRLLAAGAAHVVVTGEESIEERVREITHGAGAEIAVDPVGGPQLADLASAMRRGGTIILYGRLDSRDTPLPILQIIGGGLVVRGFVFADFVASTKNRNKLAAFVLEGLRDGSMEPVVDSVHSLSAIASANDRVESGEQFGKVIVLSDSAKGESQA